MATSKKDLPKVNDQLLEVGNRRKILGSDGIEMHSTADPEIIAIKRRLAQREKELAVLGTIFQAMGKSLSLKEILEKALEQVLSTVDSDTGWICMIDEDGSCHSFVGEQGLCLEDDTDNASRTCLLGCVCHRVRKTSKTIIVNNLKQGCPLFHIATQRGQKIVGHVSTPLTSQTRIVGQLNIAFEDPNIVKNLDLDYLTGLGSQLGTAIENAQLWSEIRSKDALRAELLRKVVIAQEEERKRISRELHDEMGQILTSMLIHLRLMDGMSDREEINAMNQFLKGSVSELIETIHNMALELRPSVLDDLGLVSALANYTTNCRDRLGLEVDFVSIGMEGLRLPVDFETNLYRIVQESLTNVARYAHTKKASVILKLRDNTIVLFIEDNGVGFKVNEVMSSIDKRFHLGLYSMQERASQIGGRMTIESTSGSGTTVYVEVPLPDNN